MKSVGSVLRAYTDQDLAALGGRPKKPLVVESLTAELKGIATSNMKVFWMCVAMVLALFVVHVVLVLVNVQTPTKVQTGAGAGIIGLSATVLISKMIGLWREKVRTEAVLALLPSVNLEMQKTLINVLAKRFSS